ncbi:myelin protein zero-like protein 1 isoform A [Alligator mississippiensis]|uniref:Myelin protein zero-like protein 1 isoform A n=2 Tax=Alligator mississippiensis TaxID=8496 RepID=A0A151MDJ3_ALLMI|nr:myelin protein zero-like protein 1 isoform A [Alligator mississippiensis]
MKSGKRTRIQVSQNNQDYENQLQSRASFSHCVPHTQARHGKLKTMWFCLCEDSLTVFPMMMVAGVAVAAVVGVVLLISLIACIVVRKKNSIKHYSGCSTPESLMSPVKQAPRKSPSDMGCLVNSVPTRSHQGPVIYAQLDHSGGQHSDKINKSESVVYADIWKN